MDALLDTLKNFGAGRLAMMLLTFFGLIVFFIFIAVRSSAPTLTLLYGDLSMADSTEVASKLDVAHITYSLSEDGTKVSVPPKEVGKARMLLAQEGLPRQGSVGYEIFDQKQSFGTTSFQQNINQLRALEGELARTISTLEQIKSARVHLVLPQHELFSRDTHPASASVFLNLRNSAGMGNEQIQSIQHLVAAAVPMLKAQHVAIIDQDGNLLAKGEDADNEDTSARNSEEARQKYEVRLSRQIEDMIGRIVGYGRVRVTVTADLDLDVTSKNSESYNPEGQVARSTQTVSEENVDNSNAPSGSVSVQNNLPGLPAAGGAATTAGTKGSRTEEVTNYEISKTIENTIRASGQVQKQSIAVLVDGRYEPDTSVTKPEKAPEDWAPPKKYVARSQDELDKISSLVKSSIGYDESRGDNVSVVNMQFAEGDTTGGSPVKDDSLIMGFPKADLLGVAETVSLSLVAVLIILLVLRPLVMHFAAAAVRGGGQLGSGDPALLSGQVAQAQLGPPGGGGDAPMGELESMIDMSAVEGKVKASSVQKISELVTNHPNETVSVIRQWMSQETT